MSYLFEGLVFAWILGLLWVLWDWLFPDNEPEPYFCVPTNTEVEVPTKQFNPKKIEALTICVGYADILAWTLPYNKSHFDRFVVVTSSKDIATQKLCQYYHVECIITDVFYEGGGFNKGKGINKGLEVLDKDGWVVHMDADIYLPPRTREILHLLPLSPDGLYSIDRANVMGFDEWIHFLECPHNQHSNNGFMYVEHKHGARLLNLDRDGYVNIGYFQLWSPTHSSINRYPDFHTGADRNDTLFAYNWKRENRHLIPEIICYHLESEANAPLGANWRGRTTKRFGL